MKIQFRKGVATGKVVLIIPEKGIALVVKQNKSCNPAGTFALRKDAITLTRGTNPFKVKEKAKFTLRLNRKRI